MKTTSFEISKRLAEIGFEVEALLHWYEWDKARGEKDLFTLKTEFEASYHCLLDLHYRFPAYDLETILEALPKSVDSAYYSLAIHFDGEYVDSNHAELSYLSYKDFVACEDGVNLETSYNGRECIADTAARLLILLHERGLVKFGDKK